MIDCVGSFNIQLRIRNKKEPVPFEINPRFSGTTSIRAHYGFNEPKMYIQNYYLNKPINNNFTNIKKGVCFRYVEEIFLDGAKFEMLNKKIGKGIIKKWF